MKSGIKELEDREKQLEAERDETLVKIGNLVHDSVPVSDNEVRLGDVGIAPTRGGACLREADRPAWLFGGMCRSATCVPGRRAVQLKAARGAGMPARQMTKLNTFGSTIGCRHGLRCAGACR